MVVEELARNLAERFRSRTERLPATTELSPRRRYELDWLRVMIVLGAMVFHAVYKIEVYFPQARAETLTQVGSAVVIQWGLPLLFLVAGASAWLSLAHRTGQQFLNERVLHLLVPFLVSVLTVIPITMYVSSLISSGPHRSFFQVYAAYFHGYGQLFRGNPLDHLVALWDNLWFIFVIFLCSLLTLPLILLLKEPRGRRMFSLLVPVCRVPGGILLVGLLFVVLSWCLGMVLPTTGTSTLWLATLYVLSFIAGVLLYADPAIEQAVARDGPTALVLAMLGFVSEQFLVPKNGLPLPHFGGSVLSALLAASVPWFGVIGFVGLGKRVFSFTSRALEYLREAVFPYFLLHMLIFSTFGYIFLELARLPGVVQVVTIISCSVLSLALLYEFLIKRTAFLRFTFGLKPYEMKSHRLACDESVRPESTHT